MTPAQKDIFLSVISTGWMCGLRHPFECYANSQRAISMYTPFSEFTTRAREIDDAFLAFLNEARVPGEPEWTLARLNEALTHFYDKK